MAWPPQGVMRRVEEVPRHAGGRQRTSPNSALIRARSVEGVIGGNGQHGHDQNDTRNRRSCDLAPRNFWFRPCRPTEHHEHDAGDDTYGENFRRHEKLRNKPAGEHERSTSRGCTKVIPPRSGYQRRPRQHHHIQVPERHAVDNQRGESEEETSNRGGAEGRRESTGVSSHRERGHGGAKH